VLVLVIALVISSLFYHIQFCVTNFLYPFCLMLCSWIVSNNFFFDLSLLWFVCLLCVWFRYRCVLPTYIPCKCVVFIRHFRKKWWPLYLSVIIWRQFCCDFCFLVCNVDEIECENYNYECRPKDKFTKCTDGPYKGQCVSRTVICDNFNVCGGTQRECRKSLCAHWWIMEPVICWQKCIDCANAL